MVADRDNEQMIEAIDNLDKDKVLICAKSTRQIVALVSQTDFVKQLAIRGYSYMYITSKTGAVIDGEKVDRESFFDTLNEWGRTDKKFVVLHHSYTSEGINVNGLEAVLFMRSMDYIGISQTIGRVIRKGNADKVFGLVYIPVYSNVGISTARKVEATVVDTIQQRRGGNIRSKLMNLVKELETNVDWDRVFGVVDSLYSDEGFTSNADNARATMVKSFQKRVGDFEWGDMSQDG